MKYVIKFKKFGREGKSFWYEISADSMAMAESRALMLFPAMRTAIDTKRFEGKVLKELPGDAVFMEIEETDASVQDGREWILCGGRIVWYTDLEGRYREKLISEALYDQLVDEGLIIEDLQEYTKNYWEV